MDVAIYSSILKWRGENPYEEVESDIHNKTIPIGEKVFRQDIFHDKCVWVNKHKQDFIYFIQSRHPLIACFLCPDKHPYSKSDRRGTLVIMFSLGSFWAFVSCLIWAYGANSVGIGDVEGINPTKEVFLLRLLCSMGNGIVLWFLDLSLTKIQSCHCAETQHTTSWYIICKVFASMTIWVYFGIALFVFAFSLYMVIVLKLVWMFLMVFSFSFICSWMFQFVGLYIRFRICWMRDHEMVENTDRKCKYYLTYKDYEEYRYSNKLNEISPKNSARNVFEKSEGIYRKSSIEFSKTDKGIDGNPLLLEIDDEDEVKNENDGIGMCENSKEKETRFSF